MRLIPSYRQRAITVEPNTDNAVQQIPASEYLLYDSRYASHDADLSTLIKSLDKTKGLCLRAAIAGLRGLSMDGFSIKMFGQRAPSEGDRAVSIRVVFECSGRADTPKNAEYLHSRMLDLESESTLPPARPSRMAKKPE